MQDGSLEYSEGTGRDRVSCACRSARGEANNILPSLLVLPEPAMTDAGQGLALKGADEVGPAVHRRTITLDYRTHTKTAETAHAYAGSSRGDERERRLL